MLSRHSVITSRRDHIVIVSSSGCQLQFGTTGYILSSAYLIDILSPSYLKQRPVWQLPYN